LGLGGRRRQLLAKGRGFGAGPLGLAATDAGASSGVGSSDGIGDGSGGFAGSGAGSAAMLQPGWSAVVDVFSVADCRQHVPYTPQALELPVPQGLPHGQGGDAAAAAAADLSGGRRNNNEAAPGPVALLPSVLRELERTWRQPQS
jgi:hypothetical protein